MEIELPPAVEWGVETAKKGKSNAELSPTALIKKSNREAARLFGYLSICIFIFIRFVDQLKLQYIVGKCLVASHHH